jgi:hypothetical protein
MEEDNDFKNLWAALIDKNPILNFKNSNFVQKFRIVNNKMFNLTATEAHLCVPKPGGRRGIFVREHHIIPLAAHVGINRTLASLSERF